MPKVPKIDSLRLHTGLLTQPLPGSLSLEATNFCNLKCTHCGHTQFPKFEKGHLDLSLLEKVAPVLGPGKIENLALSDFGEPLLSPRWKRLFGEAKRLDGVRLSFITNAVLLDRHLDELAHPGLDITVSLDGATEETFSRFRGEGYLEKIIRNLESLRDRESAGLLPRSQRTFISVLSRVNVHEIPDIVELAHRLGFSSCVFSFQLFFDRDRYLKESLNFARGVYDRWIAAGTARARELGVHIIHPDSFDGRTAMEDDSWKKSWLWRDDLGRVRCGAIAGSCYVKHHGQVEACCVAGGYPLGSLHDDSFLDIWHGSHYRRLRHAFLTDDWTPTCQNCSFWQSLDIDREQSAPARSNTASRGLMPSLQIMATRDDQLYEAVNAMAVIWWIKGQRSRALDLMQQASRINPDDTVVAENLRFLERTS